MDSRQPNSIAAKYFAVYLAEDLTSSKEYDEAEHLLEYVFQKWFKYLETVDILTLSSYISPERVAFETKDFFSCYKVPKHMHISSVLKDAALTLQRLRSLQSGHALTGSIGRRGET